MNEPVWLTLEEIIETHRRQLETFGGPAGIRDEGALESAITRPVNRWVYEQAELPELAAAYAYGIAKNHPFVDGNKRAAFLTMMAFLLVNDVAFDPSPDEATAVMLDLAAGTLSEADLVRWIRDRWPP